MLLNLSFNWCVFLLDSPLVCTRALVVTFPPYRPAPSRSIALLVWCPTTILPLVEILFENLESFVWIDDLTLFSRAAVGLYSDFIKLLERAPYWCKRTTRPSLMTVLYRFGSFPVRPTLLTPPTREVPFVVGLVPAVC